MSRGTLFYPAILLAAAALIWGVLRIGSTYLQAATDVSGTWALRPINASEAVAAKPITFEQSGKYLRATIDKKSYTLKMIQDDGVHLKLAGSLPDSAGDIAVESKGKDKYEFDSPLIGGRMAGTRETHAR